MSVVVNPQIVLLFNVNGNAHAVIDGVAIPVNTPSLLIAGHDDGAIARVMRTAVDGTVRIDPTGTTIQPITHPAFDVPLSSLATEFTLASLFAAFLAEDFASETTLASFLAAFLAEDFASETTLATLLAAFIAEDFASETTLAAFLAAFIAEDFATETTLLTRATEATLLTRLSKADFEARINTLGQKTMAASTPVVLPSDQAVTVVFGPPGGGQVLPQLINLFFNKSDGAIVANVYKRVLTYTIPVGRAGYLIRFTTSQTEVAFSRAVAETNMGSIVVSTNVFTDGAAYVAPQWSALIQAAVTTAIAGGPGNVVLTVTYVNEVGTAGRIGTITIPRGSAVGSRWDMVFQGTDLGAQDITAVSAAPLVAGVANLLGFIQLTFHNDPSTAGTTIETVFNPGAVSFPAGTVLGIEYQGGTVSKQRTLGALVQLVVP